MKYVFVEESWEDYLYWQQHDKKKLKRINELLKDIARHLLPEKASRSHSSISIKAFGREE